MPNKRMIRALLSLTGVLFFALILSNHPAAGHEGEQHAAPAGAAPAPQPAGPLSISGFGEKLELTVQYLPFEAKEKVPLKIFLAELETNKPVSSATIQLSLAGPGAETEIHPAAGEAPGEYRAEVLLPDRTAVYSFLVDASAGDVSDLFSVEGFKVPDVTKIPHGVTPSAQQFTWRDYFLYILFAAIVLAAASGYLWGLKQQSKPARNDKIDETAKQEAPEQ